ncbi:MAG: DUF2203 domain-containing protein [bacterium]
MFDNLNSPESKGGEIVVQRIFTLKEAEALVPHFNLCFEIIEYLRERITEVWNSRSELSKGNGHAFKDLRQFHSDLAIYNGAVEYIKRIIEFIRGTGVIITDLEEGIIDFPYIRQGKLVYLCWKRKEKTIGYWHEIEVGFDERKRLP